MAFLLAIWSIGGPEDAIKALRETINYALGGTGFEAHRWIDPVMLSGPARLVIALAAVAIGCWAFWPEKKPRGVGLERSPELPEAPHGAIVIDVQYGTMFSLAPKDGPREIAQFHPTHAKLGWTLSSFTPGPGSSQTDWMSSPEAFRCEVINYGTAPLLDVDVVLEVQFRESIRNGNSFSQGGPVYTGPWPIKIKHLGMGPAHKATFYLLNIDDNNFVEVVLPTTATAVVVGGIERHFMSVSSTTKHALLMGPKRATMPDAAPAEVPPIAPQYASDLDQQLGTLRTIRLYERREDILAAMHEHIAEGDQLFAGDREHDDFFIAVGLWRSQLKNLLYWLDELIPGIDAEVHSCPTAPTDTAEIAEQQLQNLRVAARDLRGKFDDMERL